MAAFDFPIEAGHVLMFARAIGDTETEAALADLDPAKPVVVPPTFLVASCHFDPAYPLRPRPGVEWVGVNPKALGPGGGLLAERHFDYRRPVHVGDRLSVSIRPGKSWSKAGGKGTLHFEELVTEFRDGDGIAAEMRTVTVRIEKGTAA